jgi:phage tail-like protein
MTISKNNRGYGVGKYGIELKSVLAGWVKEIDGGHATAEVVSEKIGADHLAHKHLGPLKYEEISMKCGAAMSNGLYAWIQTGFNQTSNAQGREDGAIVYADYDNNETSRLNWTQGIITEFGMPALDASSKDAALMTIKFQPETTRKLIGGGGKISFPSDAAKAKKWLPSNFKIRIDGCETGCRWVNKVEALSIKQKVTDNAVGELRDSEKVPTSVEVPNLVLTLSESHSDEFYKWHEDFVIKGNNQDDKERGGQLDYISSNLTEVLFTLQFLHLGVFKVGPDKVEAGGEPVRRVKVEMYCEDIKFDYAGSATFGKR